MKTILKIAWRNVWRNKLRSGVVFASVVMGIWAGLFVVSLSIGMMDQSKRSTIESQVSHLKIHSTEFIKDEKLMNNIDPSTLTALEEFLNSDDRVKSFTERTVIDGTVTTAHGFKNVKIIGVDPEMEQLVTTIYDRLDTGSYFSQVKNNPILIGRSLGDDLKLDAGKSVNLSFMTIDTNSVSIGFKAEGVFSSGNGSFDKMNVFVKRDDLNALLMCDNYIHEFAVMCNTIEDAALLADAINAQFPDIEARPWNVVSPELGYTDEMMGTSIMIILLIIIFALTFGIVNTMLMAVLERKRELGMLLCVGMNKRKVFIMIMFETIFLSLAAAPIGLLISWATISYFGNHGINLMDVEDAMYQFGYDPMVYTKLDASVYITITMMIMIAATISSIYPARKALKYNPAEAVRAI
ncbi:MAG: FtsX-like permease family protein [Crocinitomicaceae bacterium]|nr:FtsX-like permease family protein [Crocinitomicaceae bacterium]